MPHPSKVAPEIRNRRALHDYHIEEKFEAGLVLVGTEVKSVRAGKVQLQDSFVRIDRGVPILSNVYIDEYVFGNLNNHEPRRNRKLLLNRREINRILGSVQSGGKTVIPLRLYFRNGKVKAEIAVATGKKLHDKRETLRKKEASREAERAVRNFQMKGSR